MNLCSLFLALSSLKNSKNFLKNFLFTSSSNRLIEKFKKGVGQSKPLVAKPKQSKLAIVKNTSSKHKQRSHKLAPNLEFYNTQDDPIEIEEAKDEGSVQRENISFIKDGSKKKDSSAAYEGGYSSNDLSESKEGPFFSWSRLHLASSSGLFTFSSSSEHFTFPLLSFYQLSGSLPLSFSGLSVVYFAS